MPAMTRYVHTNVVARDWRKLAGFYTLVFGCKRVPPGRNLAGDWLDGLTSLKNAHIRGMHLRLPGHGAAGPTLEIFEYSPKIAAGLPCINRPGFAHIAFSVPDVKKTLLAVVRGAFGSGAGVAGNTAGCLHARRRFYGYPTMLGRLTRAPRQVLKPYNLGLYLLSNTISRREILRKQGRALGPPTGLGATREPA